MLEAAEKDGESFIPVSGARRESVSHCQSNGLFVLRGRVRCMWGGGLCDKDNMPALFAIFLHYYYYYYLLLLLLSILSLLLKEANQAGVDITPNIFLAHTPAGAESDLKLWS